MIRGQQNIYLIARRLAVLEQRTGENAGTTDERLEALETIDAAARLETLETIDAAARLEALETIDAAARLETLENNVDTYYNALIAMQSFLMPVGAVLWTDEIGEFDLGTGLGVAGGNFEGWVMMDGRNGTRDMQGLFVVGYSNDVNSEYHTIGHTGGEESHTLTVDELPAHTHEYDRVPDDGTGTSLNSSGSDAIQNAPQTVTATTEAGSDVPHENRPPFIVMMYVKKIA